MSVSAILSLLSGTKLGRALAGSLLSVLMVMLALKVVFEKGRQKERDQQKMAKIDALRTKIRVDREFRNMSRAERDAEFAKWVRD